MPDFTVDPRAGLPQHQANSLKVPAKPGFPHPLSPQCLLAPVVPVAPKDILGTKLLVGSHKPRIWLNPVHAYCNSPSLPAGSQEPRTLSHLAPADSSGNFHSTRPLLRIQAPGSAQCLPAPVAPDSFHGWGWLYWCQALRKPLQTQTSSPHGCYPAPVVPHSSVARGGPYSSR